MKKSLIALTLAALPVAAMADVTLYGQVKAGVEVSRVKATIGGEKVKSATATEIADFGSRIGFKGHEHLGNNLNAIWQLEQNASIAGTDSGWGTRESFIGLEGGFGKIRAGKLNTTVRDTNDAIDPWDYSNPALGMGVFTRGSIGERKVSVRYDSPVFAGFSASAQFAPRDNENPDDKYTHEVATGESYYGGLNYENSGFFGQYAGGYRKHTLGAVENAAGEKELVKRAKDGQVHRLTLGYDANNLLVAVSGQYGKNWETVGQYTSALSNGALDADVINAAVSGAGDLPVETVEIAGTAAYRFGNLTPRVSYAHGLKPKVDGEKVNFQYNHVVVGADYDFSKRTSALVSAGWLKAGKGDNKIQNVGGLVGLRHKF
ncbi:trimeric porin PorB [Neisseria animalis]|uniref:Porin n=2 Tax=Neisseria animalis TaxID=492 RepID=A0A5P3MRT7_NEIAN|nr:trimeric porin PorB [Neisseria animalis]QEY24170.1 porin [Neisseria animalis]ROW32223.1 porin [Neisseria animalis]VEE06431.1 porin [Neisseria animalis]